ncbi:MAG: leucine-rich repeat protein [Clostridia bacterium]|nr:leucine-rich repeat protein [Clostridia bacterium]
MIKKSTLLSVFIMLIYFTMCIQNVNYAYSTVTVKGNCPHHEGATNTTIYENVDDETYHGVIQYCDYNGYSNHGTGHETHDFGGWTDSNATYHKKRCKECHYEQYSTHRYGEWEKVDESTHKRKCTVCGRVNEETHAVTTAATCTSAAYCGSCKQYYGAALDHSTPTTFAYDTKQHWKYCSRGCGAKVYNNENHYDNNKNGYCDACNYLMDITPPTISFSPNSNSTKAKAHSTTVTVTDSGGSGLNYSKYVWTTSSSAPTSASSFTTTFSSGASITTPTGTGTYYLHVYAIDKSENYTISSSGGFLIDNTPPTGTVKINNGAKYTTTANVTLNLTASSDTAQVAISNSTTKGTYQTYGASKSWTITNSEGTQKVYVWFKDDVGNESVMYTASILLDLSNPQLGTLTLVPTTHTLSATVTGAKDSASGIKNYDFFLDGTKKGSAQPATYTYTGLTPNTRYNSTYLVRDNVDKVSATSSAQYKYTLAMVPSNVTATEAASDTTITISWSANQNPTGTRYYLQYTEDGSTWRDLTNTTSTSYAHTGLTKNKIIQYRIRAVNGDGVYTNYSGAVTGKTTPEVISDSIILDVDKPVITFTQVKVSGITTAIKVEVTDNYEISTQKYVWGTANGSYTSESQFTGGTFVSGYTFAQANTTARGTYNLYIYARDAAGNVSTNSISYEHIPQLTTGSVVINNGATYTNSTSVSLVLSANSAENMYLTETAVAGNSIASGSWIKYATSSNFTLSTANGEKIVYAYFKDAYGNIISANDSIILDTIAPGIGNMTGTQYKNTASGGKVSVTASGFTDYDGSGVKRCDWYYKIDSGAWSSANAGTISGASSTFNVPITNEGTYTVRIWLYDNAGNGSYKDTIIILDRTPPTIANITAPLTLNSPNGTEITINASGFADNLSGVDRCTWQYKLGNGSWTGNTTGTIIEDVSEYKFSIGNNGTYTVRITLYDKAGNSAYKETTVQIDYTPPTLGNLGLTATTSSITATVTGASDNVKVGGYEFYIDGVFAVKQESNVYTFPNLDCAAPYVITYKVFDVFGNYTDMSPDKTKYTLAEVPINLEATEEFSPTKIDLNWESNGNPEEVIYELVVSDDGVNWSSPIYIGTGLEYVHEDLPIASRKYYKVRAKNQEGVYTEYSSVAIGTTISDIVPPTALVSFKQNITVGIEELAKDTDDVKMIIRVYDQSFESSSLKASDIEVYVASESNKIRPTVKNIESVVPAEDGLEITLLLKGITLDGEIFIYIPEGKFVDKAGNKNEELFLITNMIADNTDPTLIVEAYPVDETYDGYYIDIFAEDLNGIKTITINGEEITLDENGKYRHYTEDNDTYVINTLDTVLNSSTEERVISLIELYRNFEANLRIPVDADGAGKGTTFTLPIPLGGANNYLVVWGDGTYNRYTREEFPTHTYKNTTEETYLLKVKGIVDTLGYYKTTKPTTSNSYSDYYSFNKYLKNILEWGELGATRFGFAYCENLEGEIPDPTGTGFANLVSVENMFLNCSSLTEFPSEDFLTQATAINSAKNMFKNCININDNIPEGIFRNNLNITTFEETFSNCKKVNGTIPEKLFENHVDVLSYAGTFKDCGELSGVIPEDLFADSYKVETFRETFANCSKLVSPTVNASGVTPVVPEKLFDNNRFALNYYRTFYNCTGLTGVVTDEIFNQNRAINSIPANENVNSNYRGTFENCTGITEVDNSLLIIGHEMFKNCTGIENIYLHQTVDIGNEAFYGCNKLVDIQVSKDYLKTMGKDSFEYTGTNPDKLVTFINKDNEVLVNYVWLEDNRIVDVEAPKGTIEIITPKDPFTKTQSVKLKITATDNYSKSENIMMAILNENEFSENIDYNSLNWESYKQNVDWTLTEKDAIKTVYVLFKDEIGNVSRVSN